MPKKPKSEKFASGGEKASNRQTRSSKTVASAVELNPTPGKIGPSSIQRTAGNIGTDATNVSEQRAALSEKALETRDDDRRQHGSTTTNVEPGLRSPDEPSAMASSRNDPQSEEPAGAHAEGRDAQKFGENLPSIAPRAEAENVVAPVQGSQYISPAAEQYKPHTPGSVSTEHPAAKLQRQSRAQSPCPSTTLPRLVTQGRSPATPASRRETIPSESEVERPPVLTPRKKPAVVTTAHAMLRAMSPFVAKERRFRHQSTAYEAVSPATMANLEAHVAARSPLQLCARRKNETSRKKAAIAVAAAVSVTGTVFLALLAASRRPLMADKGYCTSEECTFHVNMLTAKLDKSIDPCVDFSAYVCSSWARSGDYSEFAKSPVDDMLVSRYIRFREMLVEGTEKLPVGKKALAMYDACMSAATDDQGNIEVFLSLMEAVGLSWPEERADSGNALGVALALAYRWQLPFWMSVEVPVSRSNAKWRLQIKPGDFIPLMWNQYLTVKIGNGYENYWRGFYYTFRTYFTRPINDSEIEAIADLEGDILGRLQSSYASEEENPAVVPLSSIGNVSAPLSSSDWLQQLNLKLELRPPLRAYHELITSDIGFLATLGALFAKYSNKQLLGQLAWSFVQFCAPAVNSQLLLVKFGDIWKMNIYKPIFCAFRVEWTLKLLVFALDYVSHLTEEDQRIVNKGYSSLISATLTILNSSVWLDEESKELAADKVASIQALLWPAPHWLTNKALDELHREYPSKEGTFGDFWVNATFAMARHERTDDFEAARGMPKNVPPANFEYDYVLNNIELPLGIVRRPLYYRHGTKAMFYGGLGFQMALEIVGALDKAGVRWTKDGQKVTSILSEASMQSFNSRDSCLSDEHIDTVFPEIPALEITYSAMVHAIQEDNDSRRIEGFSEEKVFFMTICYMACKSSTARGIIGVNCSKLVRNSRVFQETFRCPSDSNMNPRKKCSFFA